VHRLTSSAAKAGRAAIRKEMPQQACGSGKAPPLDPMIQPVWSNSGGAFATTASALRQPIRKDGGNKTVDRSSLIPLSSHSSRSLLLARVSIFRTAVSGFPCSFAISTVVIPMKNRRIRSSLCPLALTPNPDACAGIGVCVICWAFAYIPLSYSAGAWTPSLPPPSRQCA